MVQRQQLNTRNGAYTWTASGVLAGWLRATRGRGDSHHSLCPSAAGRAWVSGSVCVLCPPQAIFDFFFKQALRASEVGANGACGSWQP